MTPVFLHYDRCSTCQKAKKWLDDNGVAAAHRSITEQRPTVAELQAWVALSGLPAAKFFNTSGMLYREQGMSEKVKTLPEKELLQILASNGMMVKRPLVVGKDFVLLGFKEEKWKEALLRDKE
ncbi:MAG: arsenate reductase family protein [Prevotellaceae bacterium]|jgi:arsenate reductase|nr:arsenate reductase family protein [Prevotellaceae bacterium]